MSDVRAIVASFRNSAVTDFEARLSAAEKSLGGFLSDAHRDPRYDVRELMTLLCTIPSGERYVLLGRLIGCCDGPESLEGMESLCSFVGNYILDDSECVVVPEPDDVDNDPAYGSIHSFVAAGDDALTADEIDALALERYQSRDKPMVVLPKTSDAETAATAGDVVKAISLNADREERFRRAFAETFGDPEEQNGYSRP